MDLYADNILEHYRNPRGKCRMQKAECRITHTETNPTCGDEIIVGINLENNTVQKIAWSGTGCAISQAGMSMLFEEIEGQSIDDVQNLSKDDMLELLGVPISNRRLNCALLGLKAVQKALRKNYDGVSGAAEEI